MSNSSMVVQPPHVEAILKSNLQPAQKTSAIRAFWDRTMAKELAAKAPVTVATVAHQGALVARGEAVGVGVGALLGYLDSRLGSLDVGAEKIPLDGALAAAGIVGALMLAGHELATEARHTAVAATAVLSARKTKAHFNKTKDTSASTHGDDESDELLKACRDL